MRMSLSNIIMIRLRHVSNATNNIIINTNNIRRHALSKLHIILSFSTKTVFLYLTLVYILITWLRMF